MTKRTFDEQPAELPVRARDRLDELPERGIVSLGFGVVIRPQKRQKSSPPSSSSSPSGMAATKKKRIYTIIRADVLIPGDGEPVLDAALVVEGKVIAWVGPSSSVPAEYSTAPHRAVSVPVAMPGLWDVHTHFAGESTADAGGNASYVGFIAEHPASAGARLARGCWEALQRGYTSLRDLAGFGCEVARAVEDGSVAGPNVYGAGAAISQTAGHGDVFPLPAGDVLLNLGVSNVTAGHFGTGVSMLVDGVDECRRAVRLQIRRGARCIKVLASGGVMSRDDNPLYAQFSAEELAVLVEESTRQGRAVAAHVHGKPGILAAVKAGATTVEHVSFADKECIDLIKEKGTIYVATRNVIELLLSTDGEGLPWQSWEKLKLCATNHMTAYKLAVAAGVPIALGTDTPPGFNMALELEYAVDAGLSNLEAIKAATANGPLCLGPQAPKSGQLKAGYDADILGLTKNPADDVKVLQDKDNIPWVWKGGKLFKGPGVGPWGEDPGPWDWKN